MTTLQARRFWALAAAVTLVPLTAAAAISSEDAVVEDIYVDASVTVDGLAAVFTGPAGTFSLGLPGQEDATSRSGSATTYEVIDNGMTIVTSSDLMAGEAAVFSLELPPGATAQTVPSEFGHASVVITDELGQLLGGVAPMESVDMSGSDVATSLRLDGNLLILEIVDTDEVAFPVTARAASSTVWYQWANVDHYDSRGFRVNANPTALGRQQIAWNVHYIHVEHVRGILNSAGYGAYWNWNIEQQFVCHVVGAWLPSNVYNMESWQPALSWGAISNPIDRCNRIK